jgi:hypothetical protein
MLCGAAASSADDTLIPAFCHSDMTHTLRLLGLQYPFDNSHLLIRSSFPEFRPSAMILI